MANKDVIISGIRGFVGTNLKKYLDDKNGFVISGLSREKFSPKVGGRNLDTVLTYDELFGNGGSYTSYLHLAGKVYGIRDKSDPNSYFEANYELTKKLFDRFIRDEKAKKFIFLSTIHVLTESPERELTEDYEPRPVTPYGGSKLLAEKYILEHCPPGKKAYVLRPSMIHGPGNKGNLNLLYSLVSKGIPYPMGAYNNKRSFVSIENLCFVIREILEREITPGLYHLADDTPTYTHDLVDMIARITGNKTRIWKVPPVLLKTIAKIGNRVPIPLNEQRLTKLTGDFIVSNRKIKSAIGKPLPVSSEEGLRRTILSFYE